MKKLGQKGTILPDGKSPLARPPKRKGNPGKINPARLRVVESLIAECWPHSEIIHSLSERWDCSRRTIENYLKLVYDQLAADARHCKEGRRDAMRRTMQQHYKKCIAAGAHAAAGQILREIAKIDACYEPEKFELSGPGGAPLATSGGNAEELAAYLEKLMSKMQQVKSSA